jgi:hypothetical protein
VHGRRRVREDVDQELRFHLDLRIAELERQGFKPAEARQEALRRFGDLEGTRTACVASDLRMGRRERRREYLGEARRDLAHGLRLLRNHPGFALAAVLTLGLGIGAATTVFSVADHVLLRPLPYENPERVLTLWETDRTTGEMKREVAPGNFNEWRFGIGDWGSGN